MHLEIQKHRTKPYGVFRSSYRENGKVKHRNHGRISDLSLENLIKLQASLRPDAVVTSPSQFSTSDSREFGASSALIALARQLKLDRAIGNPKLPWVRSILAMVIGKLLYSGSKLSLVNLYADTTLWELLGLTKAFERPNVYAHCYEPMDELIKHQDRIQKKLAAKHLSNGSLLLYDLTAVYFHGQFENSKIVAHGKKKPDAPSGTKQILIGLICAADGCPVGVEIFSGNTQDAQTMHSKVEEIQKRYGIKELTFVGDRGVITQANYNRLKGKDGLAMITALTHPQILKLIDKETVRIDLFDKDKIALVIDPENPERKLHLCCNPKRKAKETATRKALLQKVEELLTLIAKGAIKRTATAESIGSRVGKILARYKMGKFLEWKIIDISVGRKNIPGKGLEWTFDREKIKKEEQIDGCYIIASDAKDLSKEDTVKAYRKLSHVEQAFRNLKRAHLDMQPVYHHQDDRIRAHVLICMLSYYLMWNMKQRLQPLFDEDGKHGERRWSFEIVLEKLKSIRKSKAKYEEEEFEHIDSPNKEQNTILKHLKVALKS